MSDSSGLMRDLFIHGHYSDMKITCQGVSFNVHRAIVCTQASFFKSAMDGRFAEACDQIINLPEDDCQIIERVLSYLYLQDYKEIGHIFCLDQGPDRLQESLEDLQNTENPNSPKDHPHVESSSQGNTGLEITAYNNMGVYIAADKFGIEKLKSLAEVRIARWAKDNWQSSAFIDVIHEVLASAPSHDPTLRNIFVEIMSNNLSDLVKQGPILHVLETYSILGTAIVKRIVEHEMIKNPDDKEATALEEIAQKLNQTRRCRHCAAKFNVRLEEYEYHYGMIRCASCRTRH